jgi:hypothetical protein
MESAFHQVSAAIRICPLAAMNKTPWPSQSVTGLLGHCAARRLPNDAPMFA